MSRPAQIFEAPGAEDEPLPIDPSPWHDDRAARIPLEYWYKLLDFAQTLDAPAADGLQRLSGNIWVSEIPFDRDQIAAARAFLGRVTGELADAPPLVPEIDDEFPDAYPNDEITRMARAVLAVLDESLARGEPFRAWNE